MMSGPKHTGLVMLFVLLILPSGMTQQSAKNPRIGSLL